jgi:1-acyl-sn-glycerol-3-phosphate acyltransferase
VSNKGVLGNDPFKRGAPKPAAAAPSEPQKPAKEPVSAPPSVDEAARIAEKGKQLRSPPPPLVEKLAEKVAAESGPPAKPVLKPVAAPEPPASLKPPLPKAVSGPASRPPEPKRVPPRPPPPPGSKIAVPKPKSGEGTPARRAVTSFASASPAPPPPAPKVTAPERPSQKAPKPPSPPELAVVPAEAFRDQIEKATGAKLPAPRASPKFHPGSPSIGADPIAHAASPEGRHAPASHSGSPELRAEFTAHETSPEVVAELEDGATTPHAGSPAVVAELTDAMAVPHPGSPDVVADRVTEVGLALDAAREATAGLARPLIEAASGLAAAAKAALGLGGPGPVDTWGKDETLTHRLHPIGDFLYDKYFRVSVEGADKLPEGASIIVANHSGALPLDGPMLYYALQRQRADLKPARWLVEDQVFHAPVIGVLMNRIGAVRAHPENAVRLLEEGRPVIVFPEGFLGISKPFTQRYQLKRFGRGGYVKLALKQKVPIVPAAIVGAEESMPLLAKIPAGALGVPYLPLTPPPLPARWRIRFSDPMALEGHTDDLAWVQEQNDRVRDTIAGMLTSMLGS